MRKILIPIFCLPCYNKQWSYGYNGRHTKDYSRRPIVVCYVHMYRAGSLYRKYSCASGRSRDSLHGISYLLFCNCLTYRIISQLHYRFLTKPSLLQTFHYYTEHHITSTSYRKKVLVLLASSKIGCIRFAVRSYIPRDSGSAFWIFWLQGALYR